MKNNCDVSGEYPKCTAKKWDDCDFNIENYDCYYSIDGFVDGCVCLAAIRAAIESEKSHENKDKTCVM